ncbi:MAG: glutamate-1-semialdehyde 2,1-aminomutase [Phycisphaerales bacterium]|nr:glutamate-1-semialdehyde 2,1-aminomutase [Phycisphaerales bacterium]MCI0674486.1 glutamate-1-semialdehyde 2,1-aminomutase [Phycisphaerales bacterium]
MLTAPARTEQLAARAARVMPGGVSSPVRALRAVGDGPLFVDRGRGSRLFDAEGAALIDYVCSWGAAIAGHAHPLVIESVERAVRDGLGFGASTRIEVELAEEIADRVPGIERVRFVCSGTEAVMSAVRLARAATQRDLIVKFEGCYHGHSDALLAAAGSGLATLGLPGSPGVPQAAARDTIVLPFNDQSRLEAIFDELGERIACIILEPIAGNMGVVPAGPAFLLAARRLTDEHGALLIFDEVMTGFRVARGGAQERLGVRADLVTLGKVIGGGLPVGAYAGRASLMDLVAPAGPVYQAGTLAGNPVAVAAGLATLRLLDNRAYEQLEAMGQLLQHGLVDGCARRRIEAHVERVGSMISIFFGIHAPPRSYAQVRAADHESFAAFFRAMRARGVLLPPSGFESWFVSLAHDRSAIAGTLDAAANALQALECSLAAPVPQGSES